MRLEPVKSTKTYEIVYERLRDSILSGSYPPATKLPSVRELGDQMGVGQSVVREALTALKAMNLITMRQGEGTFVRQFDPTHLANALHFTPMRSNDIRSLLELRKMLETGTTNLAARRRSESDLKNLQVSIDRMCADSVTVGEEADWAFHYGLAQAAGNPFVISLLDAVADYIQAALRTSRQALFLIPGEAQQLLGQHRDILKAVKEQDETRAEALMLAHLTHVESRLDLPLHCGEEG